MRLRQDGQSGNAADIKVSDFSNNLENSSIALSVEAFNQFYRLEEEFTYSLMEILTPGAISDLRVMESLTTHSSVFLTFDLPKVLENATQELLFDVRLKLFDNEASKWQKIANPRLQMKRSEGYLVIDNLDYANTDYTVKIRTKSKRAEDIDEMWSTSKEISVRTSPKLPDTVPKTCDNCFNVMDNGNVIIYWMEVPKLYQNADNFSYLTRGWNENGEETIHENLNQTSLLLHKNSISHSVRFQISSLNSVGVSDKFSQLLVHKADFYSHKKLLKIRKELINSEYKITWKPLEQFDIESFTIVWCRQRNELPNQCDGSINITTLASNTSQFNLHATTSQQLGVAVNMRNKSMLRGIEWAECTSAKSNGELFVVAMLSIFYWFSFSLEIGQVHSVWSSVYNENAITLHWKLNCVDEPIVMGYNITYCSIDDTSSSMCNETAHSSIIILNENEELNQFEILKLKSYRLYSVTIALMSLNRLGVPITPIFVRTMEGGKCL